MWDASEVVAILGELAENPLASDVMVLFLEPESLGLIQRRSTLSSSSISSSYRCSNRSICLESRTTRAIFRSTSSRPPFSRMNSTRRFNLDVIREYVEVFRERARGIVIAAL